MNIDGVRVLAQEAITETPDFVWAIIGLFAGCILLFAILSFIVDKEWLINAFAISGFIGFLWLIIAGGCGVFNKPSDRNTYKCIFEEDVSIQEVYDNYNVVGRDGEIWILEDKEK